MTDFYSASGTPANDSDADSSLIRAEFTAVANAFAKLAAYTGNANQIIYNNAGGTGQTSSSGLTFDGTTLTAQSLALTSVMTSDLKFTDATYDIGKSGATRPRDIFLSRNLTVGGALTGTSSMLSPITNALSGDVALNNVSNFFTGPSVAQGSSGTWYVSGTVTLRDTAGAAAFVVKLWDGATTIDSKYTVTTAALNHITVSLSGFITSPAGNLRISAKDISSTSGVIIFNSSGESKDSTITAVRIG